MYCNNTLLLYTMCVYVTRFSCLLVRVKYKPHIYYEIIATNDAL